MKNILQPQTWLIAALANPETSTDSCLIKVKTADALTVFDAYLHNSLNTKKNSAVNVDRFREFLLLYITGDLDNYPLVSAELKRAALLLSEIVAKLASRHQDKTVFYRQDIINADTNKNGYLGDRGDRVKDNTCPDTFRFLNP